MEMTKEVKKPIEAIQCANTFTLLQRKMYNVLLANAANNLRADVTHKISIGTLCKLMEYKSNDYETIKNRFRELRRLEIEWDVINEQGNKVWTNTSPLSFARITEGEGICEYEFTKSLVPFLDRPAQYAKFSLAVQAKFKSSYGLALYENCERYRGIKQTRPFEVSTFRKLMGLKEGEYKEFFAMKRRVIDQAIKEVNKHADFEIKPEYEKNGKQTVKIKFVIIPKKISIANNIYEQEIETVKILKEVFYISDKEIVKIIKKHSEVYVKEKISYVLNSQSFSEGKISNLAAYLKTALNSDYKKSKSSKDILREIELKNESMKKEQKRIEEELSLGRRKYSEFFINAIVLKINRLDEKIRQELSLTFERYLETKSSIACAEYKKKGLLSIFIQQDLKLFLNERYPVVLENILSLGDFLKNYHPSIYAFYTEVN